jgi:hypothetical protein
MKDLQGCQQRGWSEDRRSPLHGPLIDPKSDHSVSKEVQQNILLDRSSTMEQSILKPPGEILETQVCE